MPPPSNRDPKTRRPRGLAVATGEQSAPGDAPPSDADEQLRWRLSISEKVRRMTAQRMRAMIKEVGGEEPMERQEGRAYEEVLVGSLEAQVRGKVEGLEQQVRDSTAAQSNMVTRLAKLEDEGLEWEHNVEAAREDAGRHHQAALGLGSALEAERLGRAEERASCNARLAERSKLIESLQGEKRELLVQLDEAQRKGRELDGVKARLRASLEAHEVTKRKIEEAEAAIGTGAEEVLALQSEIARQTTRANNAETLLRNAGAASQAWSPSEDWQGSNVAQLDSYARGTSAAGGGATGSAAGPASLGGGAAFIPSLSSSGGYSGPGVGRIPDGPAMPGLPRGAPRLPSPARIPASLGRSPLGHGGLPRSPQEAAMLKPATPTEHEVREYAKFLNIAPAAEPELLWIAKEAMSAPLPGGWTQHDDAQGWAFFYNGESQTSTYEHPMDGFYRSMVEQKRRK